MAVLSVMNIFVTELSVNSDGCNQEPAAAAAHGAIRYQNSAEFWMGLQGQYDPERERDRPADRLERVAASGVRATAREAAAPGRLHDDDRAAAGRG